MSDDFCSTGKVKFANRRDAIDAANNARERLGSTAKAYRCRECDAWHITSNNRGKYKGMIPGSKKKRF